MAHRLLVLSALMILACPGGPALAQAPDLPDIPAAPIAPRVKRDPIEKIRVRMEKDTDYVSILDGRFGRKVLVVDYPWGAFTNPSIEVRLVTAEKPEVRAIKPLMFVPDFFKAEVKINVFRCRDQASSYGGRKKMKEHGLDFEIIAERNSLSRPAVCIVHEFKGIESPKGSLATFCLLDSWSMNRGLLNLDLPVEYFSKKGKLYVWFLRDDRILWQETEDWPGMGPGLGKEEEEKEVVQEGMPGEKEKGGEDTPSKDAPAEAGPFEGGAGEKDPFGAAGGGDAAGGAPAEKDPFGGGAP